MKKVQSHIITTKFLMNPSLSFSGVVSLNFLTDGFIKFISSSIKQQLQKCILTAHSVHTLNKQDFLPVQKQKSPIIYQNRAFLELAVGYEPTTGWLQISCSTSWATPAFYKIKNLKLIFFPVLCNIFQIDRNKDFLFSFFFRKYSFFRINSELNHLLSDLFN